MKDMGIAVLTYDHPHRKTEDVLWRLLSAGHREISVVATPWSERKPRNYLYGHRPAEKNWPCEPTATPSEYCENLNLPYDVVESTDLYEFLLRKDPVIAVVGGAGILGKQVVKELSVINVHPGLLPARRGLDVLKWAVIDCRRVGVTAHVCDEHTDLGWRLLEREVPVYPEDTFHSFAMRQYEYELDMLAPAVKMVIEDPDSKERFDRITAGETKAFRRMPVSVEAGLMEAFDRYKLVYADER